VTWGAGVGRFDWGRSPQRREAGRPPWTNPAERGHVSTAQDHWDLAMVPSVALACLRPAQAGDLSPRQMPPVRFSRRAWIGAPAGLRRFHHRGTGFHSTPALSERADPLRLASYRAPAPPALAETLLQLEALPHRLTTHPQTPGFALASRGPRALAEALGYGPALSEAQPPGHPDRTPEARARARHGRRHPPPLGPTFAPQCS